MEANIKPYAGFTLGSWQIHNEKIYGPVNIRSFDLLRRAVRVARHANRVRKLSSRNQDHAMYYLTMSFSWLLATANGMSFVLADALWDKYPGICWKCKFRICVCSKSGSNIVDSGTPHGMVMPTTLADFQKMFKGIYPENTLDGETDHLLQETIELQEAIDNFTGTNREDLKPAIVSESADVAAHIIGVANCFTELKNPDLGVELVKYFGDGCCSCHCTPCSKCPWPATTTVG